MHDFLASRPVLIEERVAEIVTLFKKGYASLPEEQLTATNAWPLADEIARLAGVAFVIYPSDGIEERAIREQRLWRQLESFEGEYRRVTGVALPPGTLPGADEVRRSRDHDRRAVLSLARKRQTAIARLSGSDPEPVFLCHSSQDKSYVRRLDRRLRREGVDTWLDERNLLPGQDWDQEIRAAVRRVAAVVVCLSHDAVTKSGYLQKEIRFVLDVADEQPPGAIFVIPARLQECEVPERLRVWHWVDLFRRGGFDRLLDAIDEARTNAA